MRRLTPRRVDWLVTALLALGTVIWLLAVEGRQGIGRDEAQYMRAGERYWGWFSELGDNLAHGRPGRSFTPSDIDRYWSDNAPDHPVVMKALYGLSWRAFHTCSCMGATHGYHPVPVLARHTTLPLFSRDSTAFRFPAILFAALLVGLVYRFARGWLSRAPSAVAAVLTLAQPHFFFHAQIACFDAPIVTMAFAVGFGYWKSLRDPRWGIATGALFGVALGVKHNAWLIPFFLVAHYLWMRRGDLRARRLTPIPLVFVSMLVLGPLIFFAHWPWLWVAPVARTRAYVLRHLEHEHYNFEYLGYNFNQPPTTTAMKWLRATAPFVETGFTVPVTTLALAAVGASVLARRRRGAAVDPESEQTEALTAERPSWRRPGADVDRAPGAFILFQTLGPMAVLAVPSTPIFGGVKHFLAAMPYLAVMAGLGLAALGRALRDALPEARVRWRSFTPLALALLVCLPALVETRRSHPDGLGHYNLLAGGFAGGASLGMNRQFWGYSVLPMLPDLDRRVPENRRLYWHDTLSDAISMYKRDGRLSLEVGDTGFGEEGIKRSEIGILFYEKHWAKYEAWFWQYYGTTRPIAVRAREGVPMVTLYERGAPVTTSPSPEETAVAKPAEPPGPTSATPSSSLGWLARFRLSRLLHGWRGAVVVYLAFVGAYLGASGGRLRAHSQYNHYVYLADGWLHGRLTLAGPPPNENDWAKVDVLKLKDGRELRGIYGGGRIGGPADRLYPLRGDPFTVPAAEIASRSTIRLVSFPPFPAIPMLPFVAVWGLHFNDVLFTALWAGLNPMLLFLLLRALRARGLSRRSEIEDLWLTAMFGVGSVYYFCSVVGEVWFTAQIIAVTLSIIYVWASIEARRPVLAGICVALGIATRPSLGGLLPLFLFEAVRAVGGHEALRGRATQRALLASLLKLAAPLAVGGAALAAYNYARFQNPFEFGHRFMPVQWQDRMFRFGLFNYHFLSRNLAAALVLLPRIMTRYPYVKVSQHGMSLLVTSPNLAYTVMPQERSPLTKALWITILATALPSLLYQNSGYVQWGYRFSLDYMICFMVLLAVGNRPITRLFRALIVVAFAINLFLAVGFDRYTEFSYDDSFFPHGNN